MLVTSTHAEVKMKSSKFTRRERRRLNKELEESLAATNTSVALASAKTEKSIPLDPTTPEAIDHWFKYSYGSWKKP